MFVSAVVHVQKKRVWTEKIRLFCGNLLKRCWGVGGGSAGGAFPASICPFIYLLAACSSPSISPLLLMQTQNSCWLPWQRTPPPPLAGIVCWMETNLAGDWILLPGC